MAIRDNYLKQGATTYEECFEKPSKHYSYGSSHNNKNIEGPQEKTERHQLLTSDFGAFLHVVKSSIGTGILASSEGFKNAGILVGIIGTILIGVLCAHCTAIMVRCSEEMCLLLRKPALGYEETIEAVLANCKNRAFRRCAPFAKKVAGGFLLFTYFGATTIYILLVSKTFKQVFENHVDVSWDIRMYILITAIPVFVIGMIRNLKYLVPFSAIANICIIAGLCVIFYFTFQELPSISSRPMFGKLENFPLFASTMLFGMEGIGTMLPIRNSMRSPSHFLGCPGVLNFSMSVVIALFLSVGLFGFWKFGPDVEDNIILNLPGDLYSETVKSLVALGVMLTYGLQLTAAIDVIWRVVKSYFPRSQHTMAYYITRASLIITTVMVGVSVPWLSPVISLVGAVGLSTCGLFLPALADTARAFGPVSFSSRDTPFTISSALPSSPPFSSVLSYHYLPNCPAVAPLPSSTSAPSILSFSDISHKAIGTPPPSPSVSSDATPHSTPSLWRVFKNIIIMMLSLLALIFGSATSLRAILQEYYCH